MMDVSQYKEVGRTQAVICYIGESDPDILVSVPMAGTKDTAVSAREYVAFLYSYARSTGKPCSCVVIMENILAQESEARRAYQEIDPKQVYAAGLVVASPLSRALGSFFMGLARPIAPTKLFDSVENAVEWLKTMRPK